MKTLVGASEIVIFSNLYIPSLWIHPNEYKTTLVEFKKCSEEEAEYFMKNELVLEHE